MRHSLELSPVGNCQVSALIDQWGRIIWGCIPRVDGDPVFCALLDGDEDRQGLWGFEVEDQLETHQTYFPNSAILVTKLVSKSGCAVEIRDFCPRFEKSGRIYRPVAFARIVRPIAGSPRIRMTLTPRHDYGSEAPKITTGTNHVSFDLGAERLRLSTDAPIGYLVENRFHRLERDEHFFLGPDEPFSGNLQATLREMEEATIKYWRTWVRGLHIPLEWQREVIRAAIALKLCQHEESGAIVAALTTSIPEAPHSERNWDYRYCWIRDSYYTVQALNRLGALDVLEKYLAFLRNIVDASKGGDIQPLYSVMGEAQLPEKTVPGLKGYRSMGPVRVGNSAYQQVQHDCYGQIVLPNAQAYFDTRLFRMSDESDFNQLEEVGERAWSMHDQPDAGLWEFRTREEVHTYSAVMCWAACDRLTNIADHLGKTERAKIWRDRARVIRQKIHDNAWYGDEEQGHYGASFESRYLDASLLQMVELRFLSPNCDRFRCTFEAVERELRRGDHMLRYAHEDDFGHPETAFNVCTFWLIEALYLSGREEEARSVFEAMLEKATSSAMLSEDIDWETGELWGNFPQTYSLVGIINCAELLSKHWNEVR